MFNKSSCNSNCFQKLVPVLFFILFFVLPGHSQTTVYFGYDLAGNRISRSNTIPLKSTSTLTDNYSSEKEEVFEESLEDQKKVIIYPNPTRGELKVELQGYDEIINAKYYLYNTSGALLANKVLVSNNNIIDMSGYKNATYILKIVIGNKTSEWKIVKE